jgi:hypothetical protein
VKITLLIMTVVLAVAMGSTAVHAQDQEAPMTFFVTSSDQAADFGGLAGADAICQQLATAAGAGDRTWHAYLSTQGAGAVNARDRIGSGPWHNAGGTQIAANVADLHGDNERDRNYLFGDTAVDENGDATPGRGSQPQNKHDILTGSNSRGMAMTGDGDFTCNNWTGGDEGSALVGHSDRSGGGNTSWNSAHPSRGCSLELLNGSGGAGKFYCFATN